MGYGLSQRDAIDAVKNGFRKAKILEAFKEADTLINLAENPFKEIIIEL